MKKSEAVNEINASSPNIYNIKFYSQRAVANLVEGGVVGAIEKAAFMGGEYLEDSE